MTLEALIVRMLNKPQKPRAPDPRCVHLGESQSLIGRERQPFCFSLAQALHGAVTGRTGCGKTTLLMRLMQECLRLEVGFFSIDFHGPATEELLGLIGRAAQANPGHAREYILYRPWAGDTVIGWNPLKIRGEVLYRTVQQLVAIFRSKFWANSWGPRLEEILLMTLLALADAGLTLPEAVPFLTEAAFQRAVLRRVTLPAVRDFWLLRFARLSPAQRIIAIEPILNKLALFAHDPILRYTLGQQQGTLDFDEVLSRGQTVIADFSSGQMSGINHLLGALVVLSFQGAVMRRPADAQPYLFILDEFQEVVAWEH